MGDGNGQRVGGVMAGDFAEAQEALHHLTYLSLVRAALTRHRSFDKRRRVLGDFDLGALQGQKNHAPGMAELGRSLSVFMEEDPLNRSSRGPMARNHLTQLFVDDCQAKR